MKGKDEQFALIAHKYKFLGWTLVLSSALVVVAFNVLEIQIAPEQKEMIKTFNLNLLILGLLFVAWAKDKMEDERSVQLKIKTLARTFVLAVFYVLVTPIVNLFYESPINNMSAQAVVLTMLCIYLCTYYLQKLTGEQ